MKIGIYLHSQTGHTALVARKIAATFTRQGDSTDTHMLRTEGKVAPRSTSFEIKAPPPVEGCDLIIFGAPVWAFSASPVIMKFIELLGKEGKLAGKKAVCVVTKGLPFGWTGGIQALGRMSASLTAAGASVVSAEMVPALKLRNDDELQRIADRIVAACRG